MGGSQNGRPPIGLVITKWGNTSDFLCYDTEKGMFYYDVSAVADRIPTQNVSASTIGRSTPKELSASFVFSLIRSQWCTLYELDGFPFNK